MSDETDYLLNSPENANRLHKSLDEARKMSDEAPVANDFEKELTELLRKYKLNVYTHDSLMARYLIRCLDSYSESLREYNQIQAAQHVTGNPNDGSSNSTPMGSTTP